MTLMARIPTLSFVTVVYIPKVPTADETQRCLNISTILLSRMIGDGRELPPAPECAGHGVAGLQALLLPEVEAGRSQVQSLPGYSLSDLVRS